MRTLLPMLMILLSLALPARAQDELTEPTAQRPAEPTLSIIYEGRTGGLSGAAMDLWADGPVERALSGAGDWTRVDGGFGAFLRDGRWLVMPRGGVRTFHQLALTPLEEASGATPVRALVGDSYAVFCSSAELADELLPTLRAELSAEPLRPTPREQLLHRWPWRTDDGHTLELWSTDADPAPLQTPLAFNAWETRLRTVFERPTADGDVDRVVVVARVEGEGARRTELARLWGERPSLHVAAGESVEGRSFLDEQPLSLQRPHTWAAWHRAGLDALAPGLNELLAGVDGLRAEAEQAGVSLVSANLVGADGEPLFDRWILREVGGRSVALVGWTSPTIRGGLPPELAASIEVRGAPALHDALRDLWAASEEQPDLVVVFGDGAGEVTRAMPGVDIVLGSFDSLLRLPRSEEVDEAALRARGSAQERRRYGPALVTRLGPEMLGRVDVTFQGDGVTGLHHLRAHLDESHEPDLDALLAVQAVRQSVYAAGEDVLLPDLAQLPEPRGLPDHRKTSAHELDEGTFALMAANLLAERTGADLSLLRRLPRPIDVPGPRRQLFIDAALSVIDEVVVVEMSGKELKRLLKQIQLVTAKPGAVAPDDTERWVWTAGVDWSPLKTWVRGRLVSDSDRVRVATTAFVHDQPGLISIFARGYTFDRFGREAWQRRPALLGGEPWQLHALVRDALTTLRASDPEFGDSYSRQLQPLLTEQAHQVGGRLVFEVDNLTLQLTGSKALGDRAGYESTRETRVQQQDSLAVLGRGRLALTWSDRVGSVGGWVSATYGRSRLPGDDEPVELEDDLQAGVEGSLLLTQVPVPLPSGGTARLSAYLSSTFDTELTAVDDPADPAGKLPLQRIERLATGFALGKHGVIKEVRGGLFLEYDFSADVGPLSPGGSLGVVTDKRWGVVRWTNTVDFRGYFDTPDDTAEDLSLALQLRTDLGVLPMKRLVPGLSIGGFADALFFRGKLATNEHPGLHLLLGAALTYDADFGPPLRIRGR